MKKNKNLLISLFFNFKSILGILISMLCIFLVFKDLQISFLLESVKQIRIIYLILATIFLWTSVWLRAIRWKYLFQVSNRPNTFALYRCEMIGYFGNNVLPLRLGELIRAYIIGKEWQLSKTYVFGTVILERILDTVLLILLALLLIFIYPLEEKLLKNIFWISFLSIIFLLFTWKMLDSIKVMKSKGIIAKHFYSMISGIRSLNSDSILMISILSVCIWGIYLFDVYLLQCAFGFNLNFSQILMILVLSSMALAIPAAPGMVGTYHVAIKYTLVNLLGFSSMDGDAFALVMHAYGYILLTVIGAYYFIISQFNFGIMHSIIKNK